MTVAEITFYVPIKSNNIYEIDLYITTDQDVLASFLDQPSTITLHLKSFPFFWKMDNMYTPNTQKWIHYYQNLGKDGHNLYVNYAHWRGKQIGGGSLSGSPQPLNTPVGPSHKVDMIEKADEVKRNIQGIKRKRADKTSRERRMKQIENVKKVSKDKKEKFSKEILNSKAIEQIEKYKKPKQIIS